MNCGPLLITTLIFVVIVALMARLIARRVARAGSPDMWLILAAIVLALLVMQGASRLPIVAGIVYARMGLDPVTACGGQLRMGTFVAVLVVTCAFVAGFFLTWRREKGRGG